MTFTIATDTFDRANNTTSLGTASSGLVWSVSSGVLGILSNQAYTTTGGGNYAWLLTPYSDVDMTVTVATTGFSTSRCGLNFRGTDSGAANANCWVFRKSATADRVDLYLFEGGSVSKTVTVPHAVADGDFLRVRASGDTIQCFVNNDLVIIEQNSTHLTNTRHGINIFDTQPRLDGLIINSAPRRTASYSIFMDWDNDLGVNFAGFQTGTTEGFMPKGNPIAGISVTEEKAQSGRYSLYTRWAAAGTQEPLPFTFDEGTGFGTDKFVQSKTFTDITAVTPWIQKKMTNLVIGRTYDISAKVWVPAGSIPVRLSVFGISTGSPSDRYNNWTVITHSFTATKTEHTLEVEPDSTPSTGDEDFYLDRVKILGPDEDQSERTLGVRTPLNFRIGRDQVRSLEAITPADASFEMNNQDRELSPGNPDSALAPYLKPGRPVSVHTDYDGATHSLFAGYVDEFEVNPSRESRSVTFGALDLLGRLSEFQLSTDMYDSLRTGDAMNVILDAADWPSERRNIDPGATTVDWWFEEGEDALEAIKKLLDSEGIPSFAYVDPYGNFVFRDRHHRQIDPRSISAQQTFVDAHGDGVKYIEDGFEYDFGWGDLINSVTFEVPGRQPGVLTAVFEMDDEETIWIGNGETATVVADVGDGFMGARTPIAGTLVSDTEAEERRDPPSADFIVTGTGTVDAVLSRRGGGSCEIYLTASGGDAVVSGLRLMAHPIEVTHTVLVKVEDPESIAENGLRAYDGESQWCNAYDAESIANLIVGYRAERLPIVTFTVRNGDDVRTKEILTRDLSDRIRIKETETFLDNDFYIELVEHSIEDVGMNHSASFGCEMARDLEEPNTFTFDSSSAGFGSGLFGGAGFTSSSNILILGSGKLDQKKIVY